MSRAQQIKFNGLCAIRAAVTFRWGKVSFYFAGISRAVRGV